ncbi:MFS transporter [Rummeliibacillus sp. TYF005]|uniref:MFS transporter n=1 Tax=unclassified Rummeliibacillus TaxID=2622809 RepID=UPI000E66C296|nr:MULTISPECIES: MFS transporter [unclassified Rummeliibacillus]RIJ64848.1 MFS transporter [Rummeliibacillus sp. POC4]RPJ97444.1 MFS transporter [Rummeliibacillus sp. TYF005]
MNKVFVAVLLATALAAIEGTIVSTAIPSITSDLSGVELISWIYSAYLLTSAISAIIFGKLADLFGRKKMVITGISIFLIGSLLCGMATSMELLIVFRAIQGIGAGSILPITLTIVGELFDTEKARAKGQGYISMVWGVSGIIGPLIGGFIVDQLTWHFIFLLNIPFGLGAILLIAKYYQEERKIQSRKIDYAGALVFSIGMVALLYALIAGSNTQQWLTTSQIIYYVIAIIFIGLFIFVENKAVEPIIPLSLFKNKRLNVINGLTLFCMAIVIGVSAYLPIYAQSVLGKNATQAGLMLTPVSVMWTVGAILSGNLVGRITNKSIIQLGTVFLVIATTMLMFLSATTLPIYIYLATGILGLGMGFIAPLLIIVVQASTTREQLGTAIGLNSFINTFSQSIGAAIFGVLFNTATSGRLAKMGAEHINLNGSFDHSIFSSEQINRIIEIIASGIRSVYTGSVVFAIIGFVLAILISKKTSKTN